MELFAANSAQLMTALQNAHSGDIISLAGGQYSRLQISNFSFAENVTIRARAGEEVALGGLSITNSKGLSFENLDFLVDPAGGVYQFEVTGSENISFANLDVHGSLNDDPLDDKVGLFLLLNKNISIKNSEFHELSNAISHGGVNGLSIVGSEFYSLSADGIQGSGSSAVTISGNYFHGFKPFEGAHPDAIQFFMGNEDVSDINITGNVIFQGQGSWSQGIFLGNESGRMYRDVTISDNFVATNHYHGITVNHADGLTITRNTVLSNEGAKSWISATDVSAATITQNSSSFIYLQGASLLDGNSFVVPVADYGASALESWLTGHGALLDILPGDLSGSGQAPIRSGEIPPQAEPTQQSNEMSPAPSSSQLGIVLQEPVTSTSSNVDRPDKSSGSGNGNGAGGNTHGMSTATGVEAGSGQSNGKPGKHGASSNEALTSDDQAVNGGSVLWPTETGTLLFLTSTPPANAADQQLPDDFSEPPGQLIVTQMYLETPHLGRPETRAMAIVVQPDTPIVQPEAISTPNEAGVLEADAAPAMGAPVPSTDFSGIFGEFGFEFSNFGSVWGFFG